MAASIRLIGVSVTRVQRPGPEIGMGTLYSGNVSFRLSGNGIEFDYVREFIRVADIDATIHATAQELARSLRDLAQEAGMFRPNP